MADASRADNAPNRNESSSSQNKEHIILDCDDIKIFANAPTGRREASSRCRFGRATTVISVMPRQEMGRHSSPTLSKARIICWSLNGAVTAMSYGKHQEQLLVSAEAEGHRRYLIADIGSTSRRRIDAPIRRHDMFYQHVRAIDLAVTATAIEDSLRSASPRYTADKYQHRMFSR